MRKKKEVQRELNQQMETVRTLKDDKEKVEEFRSALEKVETLTNELNEINIAEAGERALANAALDKETEETARRFSITKFIRELGEDDQSKRGLTGVEAEMAQEAQKEAIRSGITLKGSGIPSIVLVSHRAFGGMTAGTPADGGMTIATTLQYQEELRKKLILSRAGATYLSGLIGNIDVIDGSAITATWEGENTEVGDTKKGFSKRSLSPKRLALNVPISKQLIIQSSWDVENMIYMDIINAHAEAVELAAINGSGTGQPLGILNTPGIGAVALDTNGGLATFKALIDLETLVSVKNADFGSLAYITNPKVRGYLKSTLKSAGVAGYIWEKDELNGYPAFSSNVVPANLTKGTGTDLSALIYGNFSNLLIAQWGGLDIIVDPYTLKKEAAIEVTLNVYHDVFVRRTASFAAIKDIKTA